MLRGLFYIFSLIVTLLFASCGPRYNDFFLYHDDGTAKPKVVLLPMSDSSGNGYMAQGLMQDIRYQLMDRGNLYIYSDESVNQQLGRVGLCGFFGPDISYACHFGGADFIVATDLAECRCDLYGKVEDKCMPPHLQRKNLLMLKLRIRIIDVRYKEPQIVLQEVISRNLLIPNRKTDEREVDVSCFGEVGRRLVVDYVKRLEDMILCR